MSTVEHYTPGLSCCRRLFGEGVYKERVQGANCKWKKLGQSAVQWSQIHCVCSYCAVR